MNTEFKDHFSSQSQQYQRFRPLYPPALYQWLARQAPARELAWDCATGNGQAARALAEFFAEVIATDASASQIAQCAPSPRVIYKVARAEQAPFSDHSVDLVTVAQALHWFELTAFYAEAARVLKPDGVLAVWSYQMLSITPAVDAIVEHYYHEVVGPYWPPERRLVEQGYAPLPPPFREIDVPAFAMSSEWNLEELLGYLGTWSASVYYRKDQQHDPLSHIRDSLAQTWGDPSQRRRVQWPLRLRVGRNATQT
ncbi:MAG: class I SAM-dependent methyltransferase [Gammaproteobacteria bacterium]|jgi:SAM-dependent methyltransferase